MRWLITLAALVPLCVVVGSVHAQSNPPFKNPSLDSNCYFPQIGVPGEIDTIYGDYANEGLGAYIYNLGPNSKGAPGTMLIGNTGTPFIPNEVATGPSFNLHDLKAKAQNLRLDPQSLHFGHFQNRSSIDIFTDEGWIIYWADENGNYDTARRTKLKTNIFGDHGILVNGGLLFTPYISKLSTDSVDDLVLGYATDFINHPLDSLFLILFKGGERLATKDTAFEDTSANFGYITYGSGLNNHDEWTCLQGDFRGTGNEDLLASDQYDLFFFRNDPPFTLDKLAQALRYDTLSYDIGVYAPVSSIVMPFFPKKAGDRSIDFGTSHLDSSTGKNSIYLFRGGPDFGSHRISIDSAAYVILHPELGETNWPDFFVDAGDMTGTGNHVLYVAADDGIGAFQNFYLTGQALDNKIDIYNSFEAGAGGDTLTANADSLEDLLMGLPGYVSAADQSNGKREVGSMWLMYGSKQIPVHLNPEFADVKSVPQVNGAGLSFSPNPITQSWSVATIVWPVGEEADLSVYDLLGTAVQTEKIRLLGGPEQQRIYFRGLADGVYVVEIHGAYGEARAKLVIVH